MPSVGHRGFHNRNKAEQLARELRDQGFDTYVGGVAAYSTLGYFNDPVLNTFLKLGKLEVARLIFHELSHQVLYVEGDTVFNESFAAAVENEGLRRWLAHNHTPEQENAVTASQERHAVVNLVANYRGKLQAIYGSDLSLNAKRLAKSDIMSEIKNNYMDRQAAQGKPAVYKEWFELYLNNAKMATLSMYTQRLPEFEALIEAEDHNLPRFYRRVAALGSLPFAERQAALKKLRAGPLLVTNDVVVVRQGLLASLPEIHDRHRTLRCHLLYSVSRPDATGLPVRLRSACQASGQPLQPLVSGA